jgi:hypothetical protein
MYRKRVEELGVSLIGQRALHAPTVLFTYFAPNESEPF